jgi:uncharacterized protein YbaP (TraB family)
MWMRIVKRALGALGGIAAATSLGLAAPAPLAPQASSARQAQVAARPAMWRLRDRDTTIYLFGTIHALPQNLQWHTARFDRALAGASEIVMELSPGDLGAGAQSAMLRHGLATGLPPVLDRVAPDKRERLRHVIAQSGVPMETFDRMKSWMAGVMLAALGFQHMGIAAEQGVERSLTQVAGHRPVTGLETAEQQIGYLDSLSEESQRALLASATEDPAAQRQEFEQMLAAWRRGDVDAIAATFNTDESMTAELRRTLLTQRNARWADWLRDRMERPGSVFVAVGAGHLAGPDSVIEQLRQRGIRVERVQ